MAERKRVSYTAAFKLKVVKFAEDTSKIQASKHFHVDRRRVQEWCKQKEQLQKSHKEDRCLPGRGRKVRYQDIEEKLLSWIKERREAGVRVTGKGLQRQALQLHKQQGNQSFKASLGWLTRFKKRHRLVMRRTTHISQKPKAVTDELILRFQRQAIQLRINRNYDLSKIGNMDETPVWLEMPGQSTLEQRGEKDISVSSTGHHKERVTVIVGALADGTKLTPLVLLPGVRPPKPHEVPTGIAIYMCGAGKGSWSTAEITQVWLAKIWGVNNKQRRLLVWDTFRGHTTEEVKAKVRGQYNSDLLFVPPGCTGWLQPADVSWNAPFKKHLAELYDEWQFSAPKELTRFGNPKPPSKPTLLKWIKTAWDLITPEIVRKSFKKCGISNALDGTEDHLFNCESDRESDLEGEEGGSFEGFSSPDVEDAEQFMANLESGHDREREQLELSQDSIEFDSAHEDDWECDPGSPGR